MAKLLSNRLIQELDGNGAPYAGGKLYTYEAGTSTKSPTYQDSASSTAHANPIVLDANGRIPAGVWLTEGQSYKLVLAPSTDTDPPVAPIWSLDGVTGLNDLTVGGLDQWAASGLTPTYISASSFSVPGDVTSDFHVGRRLKITDAGGTKYATITATAYTTLTTVTVVVDAAGSLSSPTSAVSLGVETSDNPSQPLLTDAFPIISGSADKTKKLRLEVDGLTTATTRVITVPDNDVNLSGLGGTQTANTHYSGPSSGGAALPAFRSLVSADVPGSIGGAMVLLATQTASASAALSFTDIPNTTYDEFVFIGENILPATDAAGLNCLMSVDNGVSYQTAAASYQYANRGHVTDNTTADNNSVSATSISIGGAGIENTAAGGGISFEARLHNPASSTMNKQMSWKAVNANAASSTFTSTTGVGVGVSATLTNSDVDAVRFQMGSGNITSGVIYMYGLKKS